MKQLKQLLLIGTLLAAPPAIAADNYAATEGSGKTFRCIENTSICYPVFTPSNSTGTTWVYGNGATGTAAPRFTIANDNTIPTGWPTAALQGTVTTWAAGTLGAMAAYGTSPGAVLVPGVNAFVTNTNTNGRATPANSSPVVLPANAYETVAASQTGQALGATGGTGDYLSHCVIYPTTTTPGVVTVFDNTNAAGTNVIAFPGGASSVSNLAPISIPVGALSTAGAWKVTTGANVVVTCYGNFT